MRQELKKQTKRLDQMESELRLLVEGPESLLPLSQPQVEMLRYMVLGLCTWVSAAQLYTAPDTINSRLTRIYRKLDVRNRNGAAFKKWKLGLDVDGG